ncbi:hypothetical protein A3K29_05140 [Candidatus Collierbacteria bacterium RIFOXYB2_FULL_46_14]|nr:MAG: hypothetical protein A3K29_05140 [Candidatus Collierbacteria bacterium RIFOXYB2_FULL_46_14]OGD76521.1 MAG: hypothetical protein A3K43_05140 [Candidatus Collierbacteria bacterium RIFOXYA2_FULL_46_20]OGD77857.1 MAG: hypothetical protein A3K39_05140 [Candidatus Collierbacteria bacterium RIFOXYC2_FULL_43_15]OGD82579.1 MAG: hypothetical protein A3K36_05140 [Candidatus Collierbacteria bacterium RIFOXYD2_FULL_45_13]
MYHDQPSDASFWFGKVLLQLTSLFVVGMISASAAIFTDGQFLGSVCFVSLGDVVEVTAFTALQTHVLSGTFFCHNLLIYFGYDL